MEEEPLSVQCLVSYSVGAWNAEGRAEDGALAYDVSEGSLKFIRPTCYLELGVCGSG